MDHFAYYMIRVRRPAGDVPAGRVSGVVERLASGEKRDFATEDELIRLIATWPAAHAGSAPLGGAGGGDA